VYPAVHGLAVNRDIGTVPGTACSMITRPLANASPGSGLGVVERR